jgi:hypothetical protein
MDTPFLYMFSPAAQPSLFRHCPMKAPGEYWAKAIPLFGLPGKGWGECDHTTLLRVSNIEVDLA